MTTIFTQRHGNKRLSDPVLELPGQCHVYYGMCILYKASGSRDRGGKKWNSRMHVLAMKQGLSNAGKRVAERQSLEEVGVAQPES